VHDALGGNGGHMSYPDIAAFDPIFFFHHCNVDRLLALWQRYNPDSWVKPSEDYDGTFTIDPGTTVDSTTPLKPFRNTPTSFFDSDAVRDVTKLGYTYPELTKYEKDKDAQFRKKILDIYKPLDWTDVNYTAVFPKIPKRKLGGPFTIRLFIDLPNANSNTPPTDVHYAGCIFVFARGPEVLCENCDQHLFMRGEVNLMSCLRRLHLTIFGEPGSTDDSKSPPMQSMNDIKNSITLVIVSKAGQQVDPVIIGLVQPGEKVSDCFQVLWTQTVDEKVVNQAMTTNSS